MAKNKTIKTKEKRVQKTEDDIELLKKRLKEKQDTLKAQENALKVERYERILEIFWEIKVEDEDQIEKVINEYVEKLKEEELLEENHEEEEQGGVYNGTI